MLIELKKITKVYGEGENAFKALDQVSLKIKKGEFLSIMGPSGSGKSTLMYILGALSRATSGQYLLKSKNISTLSDNQLAHYRNREVGFIFQQFNLLANTSVLDNVLLPTTYGKIMDPEARAKKLLKKVGLLDKVKNKSNQLSGGQIQRTAIARALIMNPSIIMADEPTGNLDTQTTLAIIKILKKLHDEGHTIILITHEDYIAEYSDRIIRLRDGKIETDKAIKAKKL